ncbi:MAG: outer membrane lipoprotein-sorting protein [Deltaproteobacteria bacterium]|nr:outer membrane lipoprotein-sorting protein [Deltaproteobacteria bacterium]
MRKLAINRILITSLLLFSLASAAGAEAKTPEVETIVKRANLAAYYAGKDGRATVKMTITDAQKRVREREFTILRRDQEDGGRQQFYVYFKQPSDVKGMVFMVHKFIDKDDDRWLYLPALDLVKRIAASDKRTSFVGSDYFYEDVSGRGLDEDEHQLIETTETCYVVENRPKDPKSVEFQSYTVWIDKKTFLPLKAEYLDPEGQLYRRVEALKIEEIEGYPTVVESRVDNLTGGGFTISRFSHIDFDINLKEDLFTERYLRRPPREAKR